MSKKCCPFIYRKSLYQNGQDFLSIQYLALYFTWLIISMYLYMIFMQETEHKERRIKTDSKEEKGGKCYIIVGGLESYGSCQEFAGSNPLETPHIFRIYVNS